MALNNRHGSHTLRFWYWLTIACVAVAVTAAPVAEFGMQSVFAQAEGEGEEEAPAEETTAEDEEVDTTPAAKEEAPSSGDQESYLMWMIRSSGVFGAIIAIESFILVALVAMNLLQVRRDNFLPATFIDSFEQKLQAKDYQGAYEAAKADESFIGRVLTAGMGRLSRGYEESIEGMQEAGEEESMNLEHKLSYLSLIATTAPMIGLLGTVQGMIASFRVIANSTEAPKPKELADGISTALFTTMEGLVVAIPAILAYGLLRNRVTKLTFEVGMISEGLMSRFSTLGKRPAGGGAAPAAAPAAPSSPNA